MYKLVKILIAALAITLGSSSAYAQCAGQPAPGGTCGNPGAAAALPSWATMTALLDRNFGGPSTQGTVLNRGASVWASTATPSLGLNGGTGGSVTLNGSSTGSAIIGVKSAAGSTTFNLPVGNGSLNNVLITDGAGNTSWTAAGGGTVSSVGLVLPPIFTVTVSPITTTGSLTAVLATEAANTVWAGPNTGAAATPTFRALVGADLPNPSASTLGGVESLAAVGSQWIRQISTSGVPTASQPAFTDISGVATGAQLPNPSSSTLGGVESLAAVAHQWINTISTSGVPNATQPVFGDIGGQSTLAQMPSIGNNRILSNISGGTATPLDNSLSLIIDSSIAAVQGDVLYRNGSIWTALPPGSAGQVLTTGGAAANVSWTTVTGTGTVTNVATGTGLTGGAITTTGTISLASVTNNSILANISGGSAAPIPNTMTAIIDSTLGSTQGDIIYRGASVWAALPPGTNGQYLQTQGAGSTPQWASAVASFNTLTGVVATNIVVQPFTAGAGTYTYTPTTGMLHAVMECVGSAGGGGGSNGTASQTYGGGGGGSGAYSRKTVTAAQVGATATIVIGAAGNGGAAGSNNGTAGSNVTITSAGSVLLLQANGGGGGTFASGAQVPSGGAGGTTGTGDIIGRGSPGGNGAYIATALVSLASGAGGSSVWGGGANGVNAPGNSVNGQNGSNYGAGGSGAESQAASTGAGGNGSAGACFITDFVNL